MHPAGFTMNDQDSTVLLEQFIALGYVEEPGANQKKEAVAACLRERAWNLRRV